MEDRIVNSVPYVVHESSMSRMERTVKRLWILCIIMFSALIITNIAWFVYESQFEEVVETTQEIQQDIDTGNGDAVVAGVGDAYGKSETEC